MPLSQFERSVLLFTLGVEMVPPEAPPINLAEAMTLILEAWQAKRASFSVDEHINDETMDPVPSGSLRRGRANHLSINKIDCDSEGVTTILFHHGDSAATDPALISFMTGEIRNAGKTDNDGLAYGAHLSLQTEDHHRSKTGHWRAALERVPNIGRSAVVVFLNRILRSEANLRSNFVFLDDAGKRRKCYPRFVSHSQLSHNLRRDLEDGRLNRVEFITHKVLHGYEEPDIVEPQCHILSHKIIAHPKGRSIFDLVESLRKWGKSNKYEQMQLHFTRSVDKKQASPRMETDIDDAEDVVYSRLEIIDDFSIRLEQCPKDIIEEIRNKLNNLLKIESNWK